MAITDAQKVDYLYKKIGAGVAKTDQSVYKSPSNEANASPILTRGDTIWQQSVSIPATIPASNSSVLVLYDDAHSSTIECIADTTTHPTGGVYPTWFTNLQDWIDPEFGSTYQVKVYVANPSNTAPAATSLLLARVTISLVLSLASSGPIRPVAAVFPTTGPHRLLVQRSSAVSSSTELSATDM